MGQETEEIKAKVDLIDFIGSYIKLTPAGANYKARCPFHNEKTPSFMANKAKQIWKCFGCDEGGDIFTFLMKIEGLAFPEALKILAQRAGVQLSRGNPEAASKKNRLHDLTDLTARYWHKILLESSQAGKVREYLKQRGVSDDAIEAFMIVSEAVSCFPSWISPARQPDSEAGSFLRKKARSTSTRRRRKSTIKA